MQQPDYRDQSEVEANSQSEDSGQSQIGEPGKQEISQMENADTETDEPVSLSHSETQRNHIRTTKKVIASEQRQS